VVGYITPPIPVDDEFVAKVRSGRSPEKRFRFAGDCIEGGCAQWTGSRCGVIDAVLAVDRDTAGDSSRLPRCAIRSTCRWFAQSGADACSVCPRVVTDRRSSS
jgi:hypothetical protein